MCGHVCVTLAHTSLFGRRPLYRLSPSRLLFAVCPQFAPGHPRLFRWPFSTTHGHTGMRWEIWGAILLHGMTCVTTYYVVVRLHSRGSAHELILSLVRPADTRCRFNDCANLVDQPVCPSSHWSRTGNISTGGSPGSAAPFPLKWNFSQGQGPIRTETFELATHVMQREPSQRYILCHGMENGILVERGGQRVWASKSIARESAHPRCWNLWVLVILSPKNRRPSRFEYH